MKKGHIRALFLWYVLYGVRERIMKHFNLASRLKAAGIHLSISALIAGMAAALVFGLWYPWPFRSAAGGQALFLLIISVDLVLGPALTFVVFNRTKTRSHLVRDLAVIAALQLAGLSYGLYTVYLARPVAVVFEVDRFRVISDVEVRHEELPQALPALRTLSLTGPKILGTRQSRSGEERLKTLDLALQGVDIGVRPSYWQPYSDSARAAVERSRPVSDLLKHYPDHVQAIKQEIKKTGRTAAELRFLPLVARETNWSVLLDAKTGEIVGYVQYDGFF